jgi:hypothetical protein
MALVAQTEKTRPLCAHAEHQMQWSGAGSRFPPSRRPALARNFLLKYLNIDPLDADSAHLISLD